MRDEEGIYIGVHDCRHYLGVDRYEMKECCGGKLVKISFIKCALMTIIEAEKYCSSTACNKMDLVRR